VCAFGGVDSSNNRSGRRELPLHGGEDAAIISPHAVITVGTAETSWGLDWSNLLHAAGV
jgi:hypothetical protein